MGAPRLDHVVGDVGHCTVHGPDTEVRLHKSGFDRKGRQRVVWRCPACSVKRAVARQRDETVDIPASIPRCKATTGYDHTCARPVGHPADLHRDEEGYDWPVQVATP